MKFKKLKVALSAFIGVILLCGATSNASAAASGVIAYGGGGTVHVRNADGTNDKVVYSYDTGTLQLFTVALSADGSRAMIQLFDGSNTFVKIVNTADNSVVKQLNGSAIGFAYDLSPDGTTLLTAGSGSPSLVTVATGTVTALASFPSGTPRGFTADGTGIILQFNNTANSTKDIQRYTIASTTSTTVKAGVTASATSTLLPNAPSYDGTVFYSSSDGTCAAPVLSNIIKTDGTGNGSFSTSTTDFGAVFSPDGTEALFIRSATARTNSCSGGGGEVAQQIYRAARSGAGATALLSAVAYDWSNGTVLAAATAAPAAATPALADTGTSLAVTVVAAVLLVATFVALQKTRKVFRLSR